MAKKRANAIKMSTGEKVFQAINYTIFLLFTLLCLYPFYFLLINSVSDGTMVDLGRVLLYPIGFSLENYRNILTLPNFGNSALISVLRTVVGTAGSVFVTAYMAYFFTKRDMWHYKFWYRFVIATMYFSAGLIPGYLNIKSLGMLNTFWVYVIPGLLSVYNMVLIKTYIESIPASMEESAEIDGAGVLTRLFKIIIPLSVPILATVTLFSAVGQWNSFMDTLLYITNDKLYTMQYLLQMYFRQADVISKQIASGISSAESIAQALSPTTIRLTITVIVTVPILCVYPFVQRYFVSGIMIGAVKG
ncbi:MAG: carbohydrate ABC transporter permease [Christensenellales bacterium]|jgi:putative aldouronate transport system permease protein